jgi:ubiquinone biosynthesis protein Coq4
MKAELTCPMTNVPPPRNEAAFDLIVRYAVEQRLELQIALADQCQARMIADHDGVLEARLASDASFQRLFSELRETDEFARPYDLDLLARCPEGSLGRSYVAFMRAARLDPAALPLPEAKDCLSYFVYRLRKTHDVFHVVTGFDAKQLGEIGLQAFYLAQYPRIGHSCVLTADILDHVRNRPLEESFRFWEALVHGFQMGRQARPLMGVLWERKWDEPLDDVRHELGIVPWA